MNTFEKTFKLSSGQTVEVFYEVDGYEPLIIEVTVNGVEVELDDEESYELYNLVCDEVVDYNVGNV